MLNPMNPSKLIPALLLCGLIPFCPARAGEKPSDPEGTIMLKADAPEGIHLFGKAKVGKVSGKPEDLEKVGMTGEPLIYLGLWGKPNPDEAKVEFVPTISKAGYYDVFVRWFSGNQYTGALAKNLPVRVIYDGGERTLFFNQVGGNVWAFLGTFPFKAGTSGKVTADATGVPGGSNLNAVKLVPVADPKSVLAQKPRLLPVMPGPQDDIDKMRVHVAEMYTKAWGADVSDPLIADKVAQEQAVTYYYWKTIQKGEGVVDLWFDAPAGNKERPISANKGGGWPIVEQFDRLTRMAQAYVGSNGPLGFGAKMQGNPQLLEDIIYGIKWLYENRYNERSINCLGADWIGMEIINPAKISLTLNLLYPHFSKDFIEKEIATMVKQSPGPDRMYGSQTSFSTGFNRMFGVYAYALRNILAKDPKALEQVNELISSEYQVNSRSNPIIMKNGKVQLDGMYEDGSFIQHLNFPYNGIYGRGALTMFAQLKELMAGSPFAIKDPRADIFNQWVYKGYAPLFFNGDIMYGTLGRSVGQSWHQNGAVSTQILSALPSLLLAAEPEDKAKISSILKTWMVEKEKSAFPEFNKLNVTDMGLDTIATLNRIKNDPSIPLTSPREGSHIFYNSDLLMHHQPDFALQLRMFSTRIKTHEDINEGTNRRGWYQGQGALFLYNRDNSRYNDNFWATVNPYRLPGITVDTHERGVNEGSKDGLLSTSPWAGGVELNAFGVASMGLVAADSGLTAQKSWFFFKDQIVCLGSEINSPDNRPIETIVENVKLHGEGKNAFVVNGQLQPNTPAWSAELKDAKWAHLTGTVPGTDVGWVFPGGVTLNALREARTGNWRTSNKKDILEVDITRNFLTLWINHGLNPKGGTYSYILLPGKSAEAVKAYAEKPGVEIVENSAKAQTVRSAEWGVTGANFWMDSAHSSGGITSSGKAAVLVQDKDGKLGVAVADPTQLGSKVEITLTAKASKALKTDERVKVLSLNPVKLSVDLSKSDGKTFSLEFQK